MRPLIIVPYYIRWHYSQAFKNIYAITENLIWFLWHFFSIGILFQTLFSPWQKIHEERPRGIDLGPILSTFIINSLMRVVGVCIRLLMIVFGLSIIGITILGSLLVFLIWLFFPIYVAGILLLSIVILLRL